MGHPTKEPRDEGARWAPIPGYEDRYEVSNRGQVWCKQGYVVTAGVDRHGYLDVRLSRGSRGTQRHHFIHRLVLLAFVGQPPPGKEGTRHLNGNSLDCCLTNLVWGDPIENAADKVLHGTAPREEQNPHRKLTREQVARIREGGEPAAALADDFGVHVANVYYIRAGKGWPSVVA